jgi:hypothetical protein
MREIAIGGVCRHEGGTQSQDGGGAHSVLFECHGVISNVVVVMS